MLDEHAARCEEQEREVDGDDNTDGERRAHERLAAAAPAPHVGDGQREEDSGVELRRDRRAEQDVTEAKPVVEKRRERERREHRGPEVEAREDDRPDRERRERDERERPEAEPELPRGQRDCNDQPPAAERHQPLERAAVVHVGERGSEKDGQRARRVLDAEVAVRNLAVRHRLAVGLVHRRVDDLVALVEPEVQQGPREREENERRRDLREVRLPSGHVRRARRPRRGRTTGCRDRTSASARAGTRRRAQR